jgi:hypothetical protein
MGGKSSIAIVGDGGAECIEVALVFGFYEDEPRSRNPRRHLVVGDTIVRSNTSS